MTRTSLAQPDQARLSDPGSSEESRSMSKQPMILGGE